MLQHRLATPVIQPRMYFFDKDGKPLVGGKIYSFKVGTDEFKPTYRNSEFTATNQNPILLDQAGSALIYIRGSVQLKIYDKQGTLIEEKIEYQQQERAQFFDNYGKALSNGKIWTYDYQSTIKKTSYRYEDIQNPNPVVLDQNGWGLVNIVGAYRLRVLDKDNVVIGDQDFKRPPAKVLTSRIYPLYFVEGVSTYHSILSSESKTTLNEALLNESIITCYQLDNAIVRDAINKITLLESISTTSTIVSALVEDQRSKYQSLTMQSEHIKAISVIANAQITKQVNYLNNQMQPEDIKAVFLISNAQIINEGW